MGKDAYRCTGCTKTFSRKSNAERHNRLIHNEMAIVFNKESGWRSIKNKESKSPSPTSSSSPAFPSPSSSTTITDANKNNNDNTPDTVTSNTNTDKINRNMHALGIATDKKVLGKLSAEQELELFKHLPIMKRFIYSVRHNFKYRHLWLSIGYRYVYICVRVCIYVWELNGAYTV